MQTDQFLRRLLWRARRKVRPGADHEPIVDVEPPPPPPVPPKPPRPRRRDRWRRVALGFIATFAVLALGYAMLVATSSRAPLDAGFVAPLEPGGSRATSAAAALLSLGADDPAAVADDLLVIPNGRRLRAARIQAGAAEAAAAYVGLLVEADAAARDPALADARAAVEAGDPAAVRDALLRHNSRVARGRVEAGAGSVRVARLAALAAVACDRESAALRAAAHSEQGWMASPAAQAQFSHARGVAFGWLLLLRGALADAPDVASATVVEAAIPLDALAAAAEHQPLFLFNGGPDTPWTPAHLVNHADELTRAAAGARALAAAAARTPPPPG